MPKSDFGKLTKQIQKVATKLEGLDNELTALDPALAVRPRDDREEPYFGGNNRLSIDHLCGSLNPVHHVSDEDFEDHLAFRKTLDYLVNFEKCNARINNSYGARFSEETNHTNFEILIRRVIIALRESDFPCEVTIPTDTNPSYDSPLISALLSVQSQCQKVFARDIEEGFFELKTMNYRQMSYLALQILDDLRSWDEAFMTVASPTLRG